MKERIKICVFSGSRAEYGLLRTLLRKVRQEPLCELQLIISGSHLSISRGLTKNEIIKDGFIPCHEIDLCETASIPEQASIVINGCQQAYAALKPDLLIVLGDRYETFSAATAAYLCNIPIAHLHGGETTRGALDDGLRHAITQISTWHFTAAFPYLTFVRRLGADVNRSFCVGPMVLDTLGEMPRPQESEFEKATGYEFSGINLLVCYHSVTKEMDLGLSGFKALLHALDFHLGQEKVIHILFTYPNLDQGGSEIIKEINLFMHAHAGSCWVIPSLGHTLYLSALQLFSVLVGNSSSGIIEAPLLGLPVVNIGKRQEGRLRYGDVLDAEDNTESIRHAIDQAIYKAALPREETGEKPVRDYLFPAKISPSDAIIKELLRVRLPNEVS